MREILFVAALVLFVLSIPLAIGYILGSLKGRGCLKDLFDLKLGRRYHLIDILKSNDRNDFSILRVVDTKDDEESFFVKAPNELIKAINDNKLKPSDRFILKNSLDGFGRREVIKLEDDSCRCIATIIP